MAIYLTNRDGGKTDEEGHYQFLASGFTGNVLDGLTLVQQSPLSMKLNLTAGNARIPYGGYAYTAYVKAGQTHEVTFGTANPSNPRIDRVVLYVDRTEARQIVTPNNPDIVKVAVVAGTPAGTPTRPSDANVNTAVSNNPWIDLADVRINAGVTQVTTANVTDKRIMAMALIPPKGVTADKIDFTTFAVKSAHNPSTISLSNSNQNLASGGLSVNLSVAESCSAFVSVSIGVYSGADFEFRPQIRVDGTVVSSLEPAASAGGGRAAVRSYSDVISLTAGNHIVSAGVLIASASSPSIQANGARIAVIVFGSSV